MKRSVLMALIVISATALAHAQNSVRRTIEANTKQFIEAFNKGDVVALANMYTMNARLMPPNSEIIEGRANIQTFWKGAMDAGVKIVSLDLADLEVHGNTAIEVGRYTLTTPAAGGTTTTDKGKYVVVWKRQGSRWSLAIDTFNTSLPATP
jgi:uncharacterized protein (TIGR02246 family)